MRKLKLQAQLSVDGYVAGPNGEMDWMVWNWDDALKKYVDDLTDSIDCILLGRKMAPGFIAHWAKVAADPDNPEFAAGKKFTDTPKVIFTKTLDTSEWKNTALATGDLAEEVNKLKQKEGKDIMVYGGAHFVSSLIKEGLIDQFHLFVNPAVLGEGLPIFDRLDKKQSLTLKQSIAFDCGIVLLCYEPVVS